MVGSLAVLLSLLPWTRVTADTSPFVLIFHELGDTFVANALNIVVLTAALSVYNSWRVLQQPHAVRPCAAG
ncbi:aromatic amino acid transporter [Enterobacter cloacae]|uniref:Aromatic amino acid transporter n=1 Tax=Enterobacter cloacae TaxID=550 RepID=A0A377M607_ENTCL|nr:aromatic amino acid transporter [Enterobacter cloacae]